MSNNKQSIKLYTEEQVLRMLEVCRDSDLYEHILTFEGILKTETPIEPPSDSLCINCDELKSTHNVCMDCMIKIGQENIELPSDEELSKEAMDLFGVNSNSINDILQYMDLFGVNSNSINDILQYKAFKRGAKWMRDKIKRGNHEQQ